MVTLSTVQLSKIANKLKMNITEGKKHTKAQLTLDGVNIVTTMWSHGRKKDIPKVTVHNILIHHLMLDTDKQALALRDCTMSRSDYVKHLLNKELKS